MKPWILISVGALLSIILMVWVYFFFAGDAARDDLFNALNFGDTSGEFNVGDLFENEPTDENLSATALRQLSLRRVAGYLPVESSSTTPAYVDLVEAGTGHVYRVMVATGEEERISNITIASAKEAVFANTHTVIISSANDPDTLTVVSLPHASSSLDSYAIAASAFVFDVTADRFLLYAEQTGSAVAAYAYDLEKKIKSNLFTLPFRDATIHFGSTKTATHYAYPRSSGQLEGYLYQIKAGVMNRLPAAGYGLSAIGNDDYAVFTKLSGDSYLTSLFEHERSSVSGLSYSFLPEKCVLQEQGMLCGLSIEPYTGQTPDTWYSGEVTYSDELWYTDFDSKQSSLIVGLEAESGRRLDVIKPAMFTDNSASFFINKIDNSLWVYEEDFIANLGDN